MSTRVPMRRVVLTVFERDRVKLILECGHTVVKQWNSAARARCLRCGKTDQAVRRVARSGTASRKEALEP